MPTDHERQAIAQALDALSGIPAPLSLRRATFSIDYKHQRPDRIAVEMTGSDEHGEVSRKVVTRFVPIDTAARRR